MPLSAFQPGQPNSQALSDLAAVGILPGSSNPVVQGLLGQGVLPMAGPTTASGQPDLATQSQDINSQLNMVGLGNMAGPTSNQAGATSLLPGTMPASLSNQASAADTGAIFDQYQASQMNPQPGPTTSAAQRLALAQGAVAPTVGQQQQMVNPTAAAVDTGASGNGNGNGNGNGSSATPGFDGLGMPLPASLLTPQDRLQTAQNMTGAVPGLGSTLGPDGGMPIPAGATPTAAQAQAFYNGPSIPRMVGNTLAPVLVNAQPPAAPGGTPQVPGGTPQVPAGQPASAPTPNTAGPRVAPVAAPTGVPAGVPAGVPQVSPQVSPQAAPVQSPTSPGDRYTPIFASVVPGESGGNANAKAPNSSASGIGQITDGTFQDQFLNTPAGAGYTMADKNNPAVQAIAGKAILQGNEKTIQTAAGRLPTDDELRASWMLGGQGAADLITHPDTAISSLMTPSAIANNPGVLKPNMTGAEAIQSINDYYKAKASGQPYTAPAGSGNGSGGSYDPAVVEPATNALFKANPGMVNDSLAAVGLPGFDLDKLPFPNAYNSKLSSTGLIATGLAMMGGRTWADSAKAGGAAFEGAVNSDRQAQMAGNQEYLGMVKTGAQMRMQQAEMALRMKPVPIGPAVVGPDGKTMGQNIWNPASGTQSWQPLGGQTAAVFNQSPGNKGAQTAAKATVTENDKIMTAATDPTSLSSAYDVKNNANSLTSLLAANSGITGPTGLAQFRKAFLNTTGVDIGGNVNLNDAGEQEKLLSQINSGAVLGNRGGGLRMTQGEFTQLQKGYVSGNLTAEAASSVVQRMSDAAQRKIDQATAFNSLAPEARQTMRTTPGAAAAYQDQFITQQQAKRGQADFGPTGSGNGSSGSTTQPKGASRVFNPATGQLEEVN